MFVVWLLSSDFPMSQMVTRSSPRRRQHCDIGGAVATTETAADESALSFVGNHADNRNCHHPASGSPAAATAQAVAAHHDNASVWIRTMMPPAAATTATLTNHSMDMLNGGEMAHVHTATTTAAHGHFGYRGDAAIRTNEQGADKVTGDVDATVVHSATTTTHAIGSQSAAATAAAEYSINPFATTDVLRSEVGNVRRGDLPSSDEDVDTTMDAAAVTDNVTNDMPEIVLQDADVLSGTGKVRELCKRPCPVS
jgi:hypothetical protein